MFYILNTNFFVSCLGIFFPGYTSYMKRTIVLKLDTTDEQFTALNAVMVVFNTAVQLVSDAAFEQQTVSQVTLHHLLYYRLRKEFNLSSQMAIRAIGKAVEICKQNKAIHHIIEPYGAVVYDERMLTIKDGTISILTLQGRKKIPFLIGEYQAIRLYAVKGQADLVLRNGVFYLYVTTDFPNVPPSNTSDGVLGVDLGIVNIAVDSEGNVYTSNKIQVVREKKQT